jgi:hypothetical protein
MKLSAHYVETAPNDASALIVGECVTGNLRDTRRVALGWLRGSRNDMTEIRAAAAKFEETAELAAAGKEVEHQDADGSAFLKTSDRCRVRWTVRSIPIALITCWAAFEDAISPAENVPVEQKGDQTAVPTPLPNIKDDSSQQNSLKPAAVTHKQNVPSHLNVITEKPTPMFAPLSALILDRKNALAGNCAVPGEKFITDGRIMLLTAACDSKFVAKVKPTTVGSYDLKNPLSTTKAQQLFDSAVADARHVATIRGYVLGGSIDTSHDAEMPYVCLVGPGDRITVLGGHRALLIQSVTGANVVKASVDSKSSRVVFFRDDQPVALMLTSEDERVRSLFQRMLEVESIQRKFTRMASAA